MTSAIATHGPGLWLDGRACLMLWQQLRGHERLSEPVAEVKDQLRLAASEWLTVQQSASARGPIRRTSADLTPPSRNEEHRTARELGDRLHISARHVRRLAAQHHIAPTFTDPYRWDAAGVVVLTNLVRTV